MTVGTWAVLSTVVLVAAVLQGSAGFGFALVVAPMFGLLEPELLPVALLLLMLPLNVWVAWRDWPAADLRAGAWITVGRLAGTLGGLWLLGALPANETQALIGAATIAAACATFLLPAFTPTGIALVSAGVITGVTETATGIGGPPLAMVVQHQPAEVMRATLAVCFVVGEVVSLMSLWFAGHAAQAQWLTALGLLPPLLIGTALSQYLHPLLEGRSMRPAVFLFSSLSGVVLLLRA